MFTSAKLLFAFRKKKNQHSTNILILKLKIQFLLFVLNSCGFWLRPNLELFGWVCTLSGPLHSFSTDKTSTDFDQLVSYRCCHSSFQIPLHWKTVESTGRHFSWSPVKHERLQDALSGHYNAFSKAQMTVLIIVFLPVLE